MSDSIAFQVGANHKGVLDFIIFRLNTSPHLRSLSVEGSGYIRFREDQKNIIIFYQSFEIIKIIYGNETKTHIGYGYKFPKFSLPLVRNLMSIVNEENTKRTDEKFDVPMEFENDNGE